MSPGIPGIVLAHAVEKPGDQRAGIEPDTLRRLAAVLTFTFHELSRLDGEIVTQAESDGGIAVLPAGGTVDEPWLIVTALSALRIGLGELNKGLPADARARLRVGLERGVVTDGPDGRGGPAVTGARRLRDAEVTRSALAAQADPDLAVVLADDIYRDVIASGEHGLPGSAFTRTTARATGHTADAWLYLPRRDQAAVLLPGS
jgi:hypothetical protein